MPRVLYYDTPANRINLDGDALLVGSDDANDVRHETLPHRGPHQAIEVAHLVLRDLVDKDVEGLPRRRSVQLDNVADPGDEASGVARRQRAAPHGGFAHLPVPARRHLQSGVCRLSQAAGSGAHGHDDGIGRAT